MIDTPMITAKALNLTSYVFQLIALWLATRVDIKAMALSKAEDDLPEDHLAEIFHFAVEGKQRTPSESEEKYNELAASNNASRSAALLRWATALVFISITCQAIATYITPS